MNLQGTCKCIQKTYVLDFKQLKDFFHYAPTSFKQKREDLLPSYGFNRKLLVSLMKDYHLSLDAPRESLSSLDLLLDPSTTAVVTGQQAGVLTGPLYTIYKVISLLHMVERLKGEGIVTVPIFWIASEDHDFQEINHIHLLNKENQLRSLTLRGEETGAPVDTIGTEGVDELLSALRDETPKTQFKGEVMDLLFRTLQESKTLVDWFGRLLLSLFPDSGLLLFNPLMEGLRETTTPFFRDLYEKRRALKGAMDAAEEGLLRAGFPVQVKQEEGRLPFFVLKNGQRQALFEKEAGFTDRAGELLYSFSQLQALLDKGDPITSTVLTRPLLQGFILPTLVYLAGPGELAYHAQLKGAFQVMGQRLPILYPRPQMTVMEGRVAHHMEEYQLNLKKVLFHLEEERDNRIKESFPLTIEDLFLQLKERWQGEYRELIGELTRIDRDLQVLGEKNLKRIIGEVEYLQNKVHQYHRRKNRVLLGHFQRIEDSIKPKGRLQERVLNIFPFLIKYGFPFLSALKKGLNLEEEHTILYYGGDGSD